jgi:hypothetical protein
MNRTTIASWLSLPLVAVGIGAASAATRNAAHAEPPAPSEPVRTCVAERERAAPVSDGWHPSTLGLALASTPDPDVLLAALEEQLERVEERANPLSLDLDPEDASDRKRLVRELWPRLTAAQSLLRPELEPAGYELVSCDHPSARYSLWRRSDGKLPLLAQQHRMHVWPLASLGVVRSSDANRLAARLRVRSAEPQSAIALVLGPRSRVDGLAELRERAKRLSRYTSRMEQPFRAVLAMLASAEDSSEARLALRADELAIVPRLAAVARHSEFIREIELALDAEDRFVHRPEFEPDGSSSEAATDRALPGSPHKGTEETWSEKHSRRR